MLASSPADAPVVSDTDANNRSPGRMKRTRMLTSEGGLSPSVEATHAVKSSSDKSNSRAHTAAPPLPTPPAPSPDPSATPAKAAVPGKQASSKRSKPETRSATAAAAEWVHAEDAKVASLLALLKHSPPSPHLQQQLLAAQATDASVSAAAKQRHAGTTSKQQKVEHLGKSKAVRGKGAADDGSSALSIFGAEVATAHGMVSEGLEDLATAAGLLSAEGSGNGKEEVKQDGAVSTAAAKQAQHTGAAAVLNADVGSGQKPLQEPTANRRAGEGDNHMSSPVCWASVVVVLMAWHNCPTQSAILPSKVVASASLGVLGQMYAKIATLAFALCC